MKKQNKVFALYVNLTTNYISFKIEQGIDLGEVKSKEVGTGYRAIEHEDDEVNYLQDEDLFKTENEALLGLAKIIKDKLK